MVLDSKGTRSGAKARADADGGGVVGGKLSPTGAPATASSAGSDGHALLFRRRTRRVEPLAGFALSGVSGALAKPETSGGD